MDTPPTPLVSQQPVAIAQPVAPAQQPVAQPATALIKKIVLIIEDDVFLVRAYETKFKKENIEAWIASDGKEAFSYLEEKAPPAMVLLDLMLPGVSGYDVLKAIRAKETWKKVPVLIVSNLGAPQDIQKGKELGATDYLVKSNVKISAIIERAKMIIESEASYQNRTIYDSSTPIA